METQQQINFLTFGGGSPQYHKRVKETIIEVKQFDIFDNIFGYTDLDLKKDEIFWNKHGEFIENNKRGYGYWIWKSYLILKTLKNINYNDIIVYADVGCHYNIYNKPVLLEYINILNNSKYHGILSFELEPYRGIPKIYCGGNLEKEYIKGDLFKYFNYETNNDIKNSLQNCTTYMVVKKNYHSIKFIEKWYEICCNYHLLSDIPSIEPNEPEFIEHRHDQSIFSLLVKTYGSEKLLAQHNVIMASRDRG
jgi:hypothetical protein